MTTTTNEANKEEEDDDYDLLYGDVGDFSDDFEERKTTTTKRSGTTHDAIETGTDGDFAIGKKGRTDEDQNQEDQGRTTKEHERGGEKEEEDKTEEDDDDEEKNTSVYVANLTWWTTDRKVEQLAGEFGVVKRIHFFTEKKNGKSKGCAAVEFTTAKAAELCAENLNKRAIEGKACVVTRAPSTRDGDAGTTTLPRAPLGPPPDTAWKGPIPAGQGMSTTQAQLNALQQQQKMKLLMMQQHMKAKMSGQQKSSTTGAPNPKMPPRENLDATKQNKNDDDGSSPTAGQRERPNSPTPLAGMRQNNGRGRGRSRGGQRTRAESPPAAQMGGRGRGGGRKRARR